MPLAEEVGSVEVDWEGVVMAGVGSEEVGTGEEVTEVVGWGAEDSGEEDSVEGDWPQQTYTNPCRHT